MGSINALVGFKQQSFGSSNLRGCVFYCHGLHFKANLLCFFTIMHKNMMLRI